MIVLAYLLLLGRPFRVEALESNFLIHALGPSTAWPCARSPLHDLRLGCGLPVFQSSHWYRGEQYTQFMGFLGGLNQVVPMKHLELKLTHSSWLILAVCLFTGNLNEREQFWKQIDLDSNPASATNSLWILANHCTYLCEVGWGFFKVLTQHNVLPKHVSFLC